jgi:predicted DNA-binding WGR domain protein
MTTPALDPIHLRRIDPDRNMRRFYALSVQPTLFGGASLVRAWGRIGTSGQSLIETFDHPVDTVSAFVRLERTKRRRGYRDAPRTTLP